MYDIIYNMVHLNEHTIPSLCSLTMHVFRIYLNVLILKKLLNIY